MKTLLLLAGFALLVPGAHAECEKQIQLVGRDLRGVTLTDAQKQAIGGILHQARRYCWVHQEAPAMEYVARARAVAGIKPTAVEFDWENVPLDSLPAPDTVELPEPR